MAKLYGTADPTLVSAAFRHGQSMVPSDTKAIEEWRVTNFKEFTTGVSEAFDKIYADNKKTMDLLTDSADKALTVMETGGMANDYNLGMHNDVVNDFKEKLKDIPKGRKGDLDRSKLRSEMNNYFSNIQGGNEMFIGMTQNAANSRLLTDLGDDRAKLFKAILDDHNDGTSLTKPKYEKGDIVYTLPGTNVKMTMREINEGLSTYDPKYLTGINKMLTDFKAEGKAKGTKWSADDAVRFKNKLQSSITSWDEIRNIGQEKFGKMNYTFEQVLTGQAKDVDGKINTSALEMVYSELEALGGIDMDGDNDIDNTDKSLLAEAKRKGEVYTDAGNGVSLIDVLKKDKQKYRDVMANFLTETAVKDFYGQGAAQFKGKTITPGTVSKEGYAPFASNTGSQGYLGSKHPVKKSTLNSYWNQLNSGEIGDFKFKNGSWTDGEETYTGDKMMEGIANKLAGMVPEGQYYTRDANFWLDELKNNPSFQPFFGGKKEYKMPKSQQTQVDKLWDNAAKGLDGSTEAYAVSTLNATFGGGFTQEDMWDKWTIGYGTKTYNLKNPDDKDLLLEAIKVQQAIDNAQ